MKYVKPLPREVINAVRVAESGEPLTDLAKIPGLFFADGLDARSKYARADVARMLLCAAKKLPKGVFFKIYFAYRPLKVQMKMFMGKLAEVKKKFPRLSEAEQTRRARLAVADPRGGKYGPHQTGGAIDITLCDKNGKELDMAGAWNMFDRYTPTYPTLFRGFFPLLSKKRLANREILYNAMMGAGFVNYPLEWWHYCFGDRMWAAFAGRKSCPYGCAEDLK